MKADKEDLEKFIEIIKKMDIKQLKIAEMLANNRRNYLATLDTLK